MVNDDAPSHERASTSPKLDASHYHYDSGAPAHTSAYVWPTVIAIIEKYAKMHEGARRVFEIGCGNGAFAHELGRRGFEVTGVDPSIQGNANAAHNESNVHLHVGSAYDDLRQRFGQFPIVVSLEVIEHLYAPRAFAAHLQNLLASGGIAIVSTPYHSYLKNLALALSGKMDAHFSPLWDHGHIKFWSVASATTLFAEANLRVTAVHRVGRIPTFAKSMILVTKE